MAPARTTFAVSVTTTGLSGFPDALCTVGEARSVIEAKRLPAIRSGYLWLDAYNRLTLAQAAPTFQNIESARIILTMAIRYEQRGGHRVRVDRSAGIALAA